MLCMVTQGLYIPCFGSIYTARACMSEGPHSSKKTVGLAGMSITSFARFVGMLVTRCALSNVAEHIDFYGQVNN